MSTIGSVSSAAMSAMQQLGPRPSRADMQAKVKEHMQSALSSAGLDSDKAADVMKQIDSAVEQAKNSGGDRAAVKAAVDSVLQDNGVDVKAFDQAMRPQGMHRGGRREGGSDVPPPDSAGTQPEPGQPGSVLNVMA